MGINFAAFSETPTMDQFKPDHYAFIGVPRNATAKDITKAWHKKINVYHPDKQTGNEEKAKELIQRKDVLLDADKRREYDALLSDYESLKSKQEHKAYITRTNLKKKRPHPAPQRTTLEIWNANKGKLREGIHKAAGHRSGVRLVTDLFLLAFDSYVNGKKSKDK